MTFDHLIYANLLLAAGMICFCIIRSRQFSQKFVKTHDHLTFALQSGSMGTWEIDLESQEISCSSEMLALWGIHPAEFNHSRATLQKKVHPDDLNRMQEAIKTAIQNDHVYELKYRIFPSPDVERWVLSRGRCLFNGPSKRPVMFAGVVYDITDSKRREVELERALKIREQFLMIAGHELKTPLSCMLLQLEVDEWNLHHSPPGGNTSEMAQDSIKKYRQNLNRITRIVDNILDDAKISAGKLQLQTEKADLELLVTDLIEQMRGLAERSGSELLFKSHGSVEGYWDAFRIEQVVLNLLINAIRYGQKKPIHVELEQTDTHAMISVRDQGIGIRPENHKKIFERFERVIEDPMVNGMGLGLYISHNIVKSHHGEIVIKSELGKGSEFKVVLPKDSKTFIP